MAVYKVNTVDDVGSVRVTKKRGLKRITLRVHTSGEVRVSIPYYLPFSSGFEFAKSHASWIQSQLSSAQTIELEPDMRIGKRHVLKVTESSTVRCRVANDVVVLSKPKTVSLNDSAVVTATKKAIKRALYKEAQDILPERLSTLAEQYNYQFASSATKPMKTRWGTCSSKQHITLNIYLLMMPWPIIDYVILHELAHTKHMNHSPRFWNEVESCLPDYAAVKKQLKTLQPKIHALYI